MYQYKVTEKTDYDAIQKAHMEEGVRPGVFMPLDVQMRKARASKNEEPKVEKSEDDIEKGKGVLDEAKWERAKKIVAKQKKAPADKYAMISHIYQKMGGKYSSKKSEFDADDLMKAAGGARGGKYYKREGTPGNYKYYYTEAEYKQAKGKKERKDVAASRFATTKRTNEMMDLRRELTVGTMSKEERAKKEARYKELMAERDAALKRARSKKSQFNSNDLMKAAIG